MSRPRARTIFISTVSVCALLAAGTSAGAAIVGGPVDGSGVIHGCWTNTAVNGTHAFVLQDAGTACPKGTTAITWNQQGPAGPAGPTGATGPAGPAGAVGATGPQGPPGLKGDTGATGAPGAPGTGATVAAEPPDANCANGGASVTDGTGTTVYACNGATGPKGDTGPVGAQGAPGSPGASGTGATVASLASGDPNCATGGASVTDGNGNTAYACNGATGPQGPAGLSTGGTAGLDLQLIYNTATGGVGAVCPKDHPYLYGGGGGTVNGDATSFSGPDGGPNFSYPETHFLPHSWFVSAVNQSDRVVAYAICGT